MAKTRRRPLLWSALALVAGLPLYLALDALTWLPVAWRDRPWPFELAALVCCLVAARAAVVIERHRAPALAAALVALAATGAFATFARKTWCALPPSEPALGLGRSLPHAFVVDENGARVPLAALTGGAPTLLVFFRAARCPYCRSQLAGLAVAAPRFLDEGVRVVGLSPDDGVVLAAMRTELGLPFALASDEDELAVASLCNGRAHCQVLVDAGGVVRWTAVSENWSDVPAPSALLQAAYRLRG